ncbi:MAG: hypothetical protein A3E84_02795 [Gammaproteobacteria bacterium RIFCSPHIGHO2_12_FULL_42_13]|nr:MAG: hypothetical protein A3E84_02795 [Gammaproteobacteria bacterium RIFCSPHIGHO2_12_FULL_42_13]
MPKPTHQERSESLLIEKGWVVKEQVGKQPNEYLLWPTKEAPQDFRDGLIEANKNLLKHSNWVETTASSTAAATAVAFATKNDVPPAVREAIQTYQHNQDEAERKKKVSTVEETRKEGEKQKEKKEDPDKDKKEDEKKDKSKEGDVGSSGSYLSSGGAGRSSFDYERENKARDTSSEYYINYGGPTANMAYSPEGIAALRTDCQNFYGQPHQSVSFVSDGIKVTIHGDGIHRSAHVQLDEKATPEQQERFFASRDKAEDYCRGSYTLLGHNCVGGAAAAAQAACPDMKLGIGSETLPWSLDSDAKKYADSHPSNNFMPANTFMPETTTPTATATATSTPDNQSNQTSTPDNQGDPAPPPLKNDTSSSTGTGTRTSQNNQEAEEKRREEEKKADTQKKDYPAEASGAKTDAGGIVSDPAGAFEKQLQKEQDKDMGLKLKPTNVS